MTKVQRGEQAFRYSGMRKSMTSRVVEGLKSRGITTMGELAAAVSYQAQKHGWTHDRKKGALSDKNLKKAINAGFVSDRRDAIARASGDSERREAVRNSQCYSPAEVALSCIIGTHVSKLYGDIYYSAQPDFESSASKDTGFSYTEEFEFPYKETPGSELAPTYDPNLETEERLENERVFQELEDTLSDRLKFRYEHALCLRYGLLDDDRQYGEGMTYDELGAHFNVSSKRAREISVKAERIVSGNIKLGKMYHVSKL